MQRPQSPVLDVLLARVVPRRRLVLAVATRTCTPGGAVEDVFRITFCVVRVERCALCFGVKCLVSYSCLGTVDDE